jgi:F-type H+-transporting ATPase subunit b
MRSHIKSLLGVSLFFVLPVVARADDSRPTMPQFEFSNPLVISQVFWMVVIMVVLYFVLSRWALPGIGGVLELRDATITSDLEAARSAKAEADQAAADIGKRMTDARFKAQAEIAEAVAAAKAQAKAEAAAASARLAVQLAESEAQIAAARQTAMAAIKPVATDAATAILSRLTGTAPSPSALLLEIDTALAVRDVA